MIVAMYRPPAFDVTDLGTLHDAIEASGPAHLVSLTASGLTASVVPLLLDRDAGELGTLVGHLARANRHWRDARGDVDSLAIFAGPDSYISPSWYATKQETGKVVPTWNYEVLHASGPLVIHDDPVWVEGLVRRLTTVHESGQRDRGRSTTPPVSSSPSSSGRSSASSCRSRDSRGNTS